MDIREKGGDLLLDIAKLVLGGVILSSIVSENINTTILYSVGCVFTLTFVFLGFVLYKKSDKKITDKKTELKKRRK